MKLNYPILFLSVLLGQFSYAQKDSFIIEYPYSHKVSKLDFDETGFLWLQIQNNKEDQAYIRYVGDQYQKIDLGELPKSDRNGIAIRGDIIFVKDKILISYSDKLGLLDPSNATVETIFKFPPDLKIDLLYQDDNKGIWLFTKERQGTKRPVFYSENGLDYQLAFDIYPVIKDGFLDPDVSLKDANGLFYFHPKYGDLSIFNHKGEKVELALLNQANFKETKKCFSFRLDNKNRLWRLQKSIFEIYNPKTLQFERQPLSGRLNHVDNCSDNLVDPIRISMIHEDKKGRIWLGGLSSSLFLYDPKTDQLTSFRRTLVERLGGLGGEIKSLIEDKNGTIFGNKRGGLFMIRDKQNYFENYLVDTDKEEHPIYDPQNDVIVKNAKTFFGDALIQKSKIRSIEEDAFGNLWIQDKRFTFKLDAQTKDLEKLPFFIKNQSKVGLFLREDVRIYATWNAYFSFDSLYQFSKKEYPIKQLMNVHQHSNGSVWLTGNLTETKPLFAKVDPETLEYNGNYKDPNGIVNFDSLKVRTIDEDGEGNLWLSTSNGLYKLHPSKGVQEHIGKSIKYKNILVAFKPPLAVQSLNEDQIWLFSKDKIALVNTKRKQLDYYLSNKEIGIKNLHKGLAIGDSVLWIGMTKGVHYYNIKTKKHIRFPRFLDNKKDALATSMKILSNGEIAVASSNGFYLFHPGRLLQKFKLEQQKYLETPFQLLGYSFLDKTNKIVKKKYFQVKASHKIELGHQDKMLALEFALLNYESPSLHQLKYKLEGFDEIWSFPQKEKKIRFVGLPPGTYNLKVKGSTHEGIWSNEVLSIPIIVHQAWYKSWYAYLGYFLILAICTYLFYRNRLKRHLALAETKRIKDLDNLKTKLYTNITHEFRTPLTVILGMSDNIKGNTQEKKLIKRNSKNLLKLVNQLLDLAKLDSGVLQLNKTRGDLIVYLQYLTESFYSMAKEKNVHLTFYTEVDSLIVEYDEVKVQHIVFNLLSNAIKFTSEGGKVIFHTTVIEEAKGTKLQIKIRDTGIGIAPEDIGDIFNRFYQVDTNHSQRGTGIGLALTKELVEMMEGQILVKSELDKGTEFKLVLPFEKTYSNTNKLNYPLVVKEDFIPEKTRFRPTKSTPSTDQPKPEILIIEDNLDVVAYIRTLLEADYKVHTANNGQEGIHAAYELIPDIIISDVMMPKKNGYEVCESLKKDERTSHIPIVLLTAKSQQEDRILGLKYGADAYLNKPFDKAELFIRLEKLIALRKKLRLQFSSNVLSKPFAFKLNNAKDKLERDFILKLEKIVQANIDDAAFGVPELTKAALMSHTQVYRKLKALTDKTPSQFIRSIRLQKGYELLESTNLNISEIAYEVGFKDPNYFSRSFRNEFDISPSLFRNE